MPPDMPYADDYLPPMPPFTFDIFADYFTLDVADYC